MSMIGGYEMTNMFLYAEEIDNMPLSSLPLAEAYIPMQRWEEVFAPEEGTRKGTIFPSLYRPYEKREGW